MFYLPSNHSVSNLFLLFVLMSVKESYSPMKTVALHGEKDIPYV